MQTFFNLNLQSATLWISDLLKHSNVDPMTYEGTVMQTLDLRGYKKRAPSISGY